MIPNSHITVNLTPTIRLHQALRYEEDVSDDDLASIEKLTVTGMVTEADFEHIREKMGKTLHELDMGDAVVEDGAIPEEAFADCTGLRSVIIPDSVKVIKDWAFACSALTAVAIPKSVVVIQAGAFADCENLTSIAVHPENPAYASDDGVLLDKDKTVLIFYPPQRQGKYAIPESVTTIAAGAIDENILYCSDDDDYEFSLTYSLFAKTVDIWDNTQPRLEIVVKSTDTSLYFPSEWDYEAYNNIFAEDYEVFFNISAFAVHPDNPKYASDSGVLFNRDMTRLIRYPQGRRGDYVIPASVTEIGELAFACCCLTAVTIPAAVVEIARNAFDEYVVYKDDDEEEDEERYGTFVTVHPDNPVYTSENGVLTRK